MDVMLVSGNTLRIKGKKASIIINPTVLTGKTEADAILLLDKNIEKFSDEKIENSRIVIKGPGEFEVGGIKISAIDTTKEIAARVEVDLVKVLIGSGEVIEKIQDKVEGSDILVINADSKFNYSSLTALEPKILIVYGDLKDEVSKSLGKENSEKLNKFSTTADKLPTEMQYIILN